jgi:hypothetical protein
VRRILTVHQSTGADLGLFRVVASGITGDSLSGCDCCGAVVS